MFGVILNIYLFISSCDLIIFSFRFYINALSVTFNMLICITLIICLALQLTSYQLFATLMLLKKLRTLLLNLRTQRLKYMIQITKVFRKHII